MPRMPDEGQAAASAEFLGKKPSFSFGACVLIIYLQVKQMVEIFTKRTELMPADESVEQHKAKRAEEIADVEKDRNGPDSLGLFKGTFPERGGQLLYDEADGVLRCPSCHHEHEGGPSCQNCGARIDDDRDGFSDMDDEELEALDLEFDMDNEIHADITMGLQEHFFQGLPQGPASQVPRRYRRNFLARHSNREPSELSNSEDSELDSEVDEDEGSIQDFVVPDEDDAPVARVGARNRQIITITSDEESDEGGEVSSRRPRRRNNAPSVSSTSALTVTDSSTNGSEVGDMDSQADLLRTAGWSPLDHGTDSDTDVPHDYNRQYRGGYASTLDDHDSDEDSDTNTEIMVGNGISDDEGDHIRDDMSEAPTEAYDHPDFHHYGNAVYEHLGDDTDDDSSDTQSVVMDRDGDTEMSVSPDARRSVSVSTNPYRNDNVRSSREPSISTNYDESDASISRGGRETSASTTGDGRGSQYAPENLGTANQVHDVADDSSDASIRPHPRRRRVPRYNSNGRAQNYDPRISLLFAEHQHTVQGSRDRPVDLEELDEWTQSDARPVIESASRNRRMTAYRAMPTRRVDPLRNSRSPSATRIISSTDRASRRPRQYTRSSRTYN